MRKTVLFFLTAICVLVFMECKKKNKETVSEPFTPSCSGAKSYTTDVLPLIQNNCKSCHTEYSSYSQIKSSSSSIRKVIVDGSMPKGSSLTTDQKTILSVGLMLVHQIINSLSLYP